MLRELRIRDFAIIDDLTISFRPGLNVITGETGAGKSIILHALALICGGRAAPDVIRSDADAASIEGLFEGPLPAEQREALGLEADDELLVRRQIPRTGKGRVYVNGSPSTVALLAQLGTWLVHIYGQHDQALLLRPASHLDLLDQFGDLTELRARMAIAYDGLAAARRERDARLARCAAAAQRRDLLDYQIAELAAAEVGPDEEQALRHEREVLRHAERLHQTTGTAEEALYSGEGAIASAVARIATQLHELLRIDPALGPTAELLDSASVQIEEAALQLRAYAERAQVDPARLTSVEDRLELLAQLSRKYGVPSTELVAVLATAREDLALLSADTAGSAAAQGEVDRLEAEARAIAQQLSAARTAAARQLEQQMTGELATLGMRDAAFRVAMQPPETLDRDTALGPTGIDGLEFHLSANPGEEPKPLARIASGGELSRIMLALKALTAAGGETPILIFDEVDAGIGGAVADAVARRLHALAATRQLLCITHLPQIAAYADHHFAVEKERTDGRTITHARALDADERVHELSRMLGGTVAPAEAERYARRLIAQARTVSGPPRGR